jgi:hypothetical protein
MKRYVEITRSKNRCPPFLCNALSNGGTEFNALLLSRTSGINNAQRVGWGERGIYGTREEFGPRLETLPHMQWLPGAMHFRGK